MGGNDEVQAFRPEWKSHRGQALKLDEAQGLFGNFMEDAVQAVDLEATFQHLAARLVEEQIFRIVASENLEQQAGGGLDLAHAFAVTGLHLLDQTGHAGHLAEAGAGKLVGVEAIQQGL